MYNRSRPDDENGKYYLCAPGGEVVRRNAAYFALCPQKDCTNGSGSTVYLLTDESAVTISAKDGRSVKHMNISPFRLSKETTNPNPKPIGFGFG